ncbi:MAG: hypothetical protein NZ750_12115 [Anaerolineae bacterium]|nr:hypothetical protein [Anaerolineae bacterium]MDW8173892.1 hypothetical protein [Anaerolineae bacterium]
MAIPPLQHPNASASYDAATRIAYITYKGFLTAEASTAVYDWLADLAQTVGIIYGEIFDFRQVTEFMPDNLMEARKKSRRRALKPQTQAVPVAMIIKDFYQEEILRGPMQNVPENHRKTIVYDVDSALAFLHDWHERHSNPVNPES